MDGNSGVNVILNVLYTLGHYGRVGVPAVQFHHFLTIIKGNLRIHGMIVLRGSQGGNLGNIGIQNGKCFL